MYLESAQKANFFEIIKLKKMKWQTMTKDRTLTSTGDNRFTNIVAIDESGKNRYLKIYLKVKNLDII